VGSESFSPGQMGYFQALMNQTAPTRQTIVNQGAQPGGTVTATFNGGDLLEFYLFENTSHDSFIVNNPGNSTVGWSFSGAASQGQPLGFPSISAANPDLSNHVQVTQNPLTGQVIYAWEDLPSFASDFDYNDAVVSVHLANQAFAPTIQVSIGPRANVEVNFQA